LTAGGWIKLRRPVGKTIVCRQVSRVKAPRSLALRGSVEIPASGQAGGLGVYLASMV
jgi:hypothetical protein